MPRLLGSAKVAVYESADGNAMNGDLLIASRASRSLLRVRVDERGSVIQSEWILSNQLGSIAAIAVDRDGAIFVASDDRLTRIRIRR
jgi:glucose/arabinose dehydrogenase